ncbi:peptidoglycan DD-metalloendopeptidase family protein [Mangrovivirga cuniculi]|uniref:Peptidase M23 n=1 Tax=Mangrovivirga cuniculi TaxID=2715131 RepID=A0A4D7JFX8_9BACT|nr:peptidoglycan DD-metalloendopeptidase family protein [Mangrovivirga cuniculi]QCK13567.1 peptidase M23 [Mangrovivirga cuniculi]
MKKIKYYYDPETCKYEKVRVRKSDVVYNILGFFILSVISGALMLFGYNAIFDSPEEIILKERVSELETHFDLYQSKLDTLDHVISSLERNDDEIYRTIMGVDPLPEDYRIAGVGGSERYKNLKSDHLQYSEVYINLSRRIDKLKRRAMVQEASHGELLKSAISAEEKLKSMPAIQPLDKDKYYLASGYGTRIDPHYGTRRGHDGIDMAAPIGTPVYATGNGKVVKVRTNAWGYGKEIIIDHGFGYKTRYAHLNKFLVKKGDTVVRGQQIAEVGNTGKSTGPHLHYEVLKGSKGRPLNPVHFFLQDITPEEYADILKKGKEVNKTMGL